MPNYCYHSLHVRGKPAAVTRWLQRAAAPVEAHYPDDDEPPGGGWRVFHNLFPVPMKVLAQPWADAGNAWQDRNWEVSRFILFRHLKRTFSGAAEFGFSTAYHPATRWITRVASRFPELEFEWMWAIEGTDWHGRDLYRGGRLSERWDYTGDDNTNRQINARVILACSAGPEPIKLLDAEIGEHPADAELYLTRAQAIQAFDRDCSDGAWEESRTWKPDQRAKDLKRALKLDPGLAEAHLEVVNDLMKQDDAPGVKRACKRAIKMCPTSVRLLTRYARFLRRSGEPVAGLEFAQRARALDPHDAEAWYECALARFEQHEYAESESAFERALELDPGNGFAHYYRGQCVFHRGDYADTLRMFDEAEVWQMTINHYDAEYQLFRGQCLAGLERWEDAISPLTRCIELNDNHFTPAARADRAACYVRLDRCAEAIPDISEAVRLRPQNVKYRAHRAEYLLLAGQFKTARVALDSISLPASAPESSTGELDELELHPVMILLNCTLHLRDKGHDDLAVKCARWSIERCPGLWVSLKYLADLLATSPNRKIRRSKEALRVAQQACKLSEWKNHECLDTLAAAFAECKKFAEAVEWQQKAIEMLEVNAEESTREKYRQHLALYKKRKPLRYVPKTSG